MCPGLETAALHPGLSLPKLLLGKWKGTALELPAGMVVVSFLLATQCGQVQALARIYQD